YHDLGDRDSLIQRATVGKLRELIAAGSVSKGMLPKLASCISAMDGGVHRVHILDGRVQHALLLEIFTPHGIGTMIEP
ncbi:MAG: acetylglutamate kinase, partial [Acidimicrobiia bacterium]|nr:acetylglutamate kinase [Acidimicrobiia bacterium]